VMIALALACGPELIIGDEPTTALDVMTQGQILQLFEELRRDLGLALLLITHDLSVIAETCDRVAIMYAGQIVEQGTVREVLETPRHPYSERLLSGFPHIGGARALGQPIPGAPPHPGESFPGCRFAPRCHRVFPACTKAPIPLFIDEQGRESRCLLSDGAVEH
jgi:peptide/nickel transport system ATP-binding protein